MATHKDALTFVTFFLFRLYLKFVSVRVSRRINLCFFVYFRNISNCSSRPSILSFFLGQFFQGITGPATNFSRKKNRDIHVICFVLNLSGTLHYCFACHMRVHSGCTCLFSVVWSVQLIQQYFPLQRSIQNGAAQPPELFAPPLWYMHAAPRSHEGYLFLAIIPATRDRRHWQLSPDSIITGIYGILSESLRLAMGQDWCYLKYKVFH